MAFSVTDQSQPDVFELLSVSPSSPAVAIDGADIPSSPAQDLDEGWVDVGDGRQIDVEKHEDRFLALAHRIANSRLQISVRAAKIVSTRAGTFNRVVIIKIEGRGTDKADVSMKVVIRVPKKNLGSSLTKEAADAVESQVATLRLIREKTSIPVPDVYQFDSTTGNEIMMPYMCISFLPGKPVYEVVASPEASRQLRLDILSSVASVMSQFATLAFDSYGSIFDGASGSPVVGPCYYLTSGANSSTGTVTHSRNYDSAFHHLNNWYDMTNRGHNASLPKQLGRDIIMGMLIRCLEKLEQSTSSYALAPPDFDLQNILVDDRGNVTGLIDWDEVRTQPLYFGYAAYPKFLNMDWNPMQHAWGLRKRDCFSSSWNELHTHRAHYKKQLEQALQDPGVSKLTERSHIVAAISTAVFHPSQRNRICAKFITEALNLAPANGEHAGMTPLDRSGQNPDGSDQELETWANEWYQTYGNSDNLAVVGSGALTVGEMKELESRIEMLVLGPNRGNGV